MDAHTPLAFVGKELLATRCQCLSLSYATNLAASRGIVHAPHVITLSRPPTSRVCHLTNLGRAAVGVAVKPPDESFRRLETARRSASGRFVCSTADQFGVTCTNVLIHRLKSVESLFRFIFPSAPFLYGRYTTPLSRIRIVANPNSEDLWGLWFGSSVPELTRPDTLPETHGSSSFSLFPFHCEFPQWGPGYYIYSWG